MDTIKRRARVAGLVSLPVTYVASIFWGLWLFPFGVLVICARFIPPRLGWLMFVANSVQVDTISRAE